VFSSVAAGEAERRAARPGDDIVARPDVVMDRAFTVAAAPAAVWPWLVQLGKKRAGWYLPASAERFLPPARLGPVRRRWLAETAGEFIDALTITGMAAGLKERLAAGRTPP